MLSALAVGPWWPGIASAAEADEYPSRPIRLVLPSTVGGTSDLLARLIGPRLSEALGQPVVIEVRPGAAGRIATEQVARAAPDGYTLLLANNAANALGPAGRGTSAADVRSLFEPVALLTRLPIVIAVPTGLRLDSLSALIDRARREPGALSFASSGPGSTSHMAAVLLFDRARVRLLSVPYAGTAAAVKDVLAGEVSILFTHLGTVTGLLNAGQMRGLAVTGDHRMADFPDVPTVAESGYAGFDVTTWHGVVAPAGTPRPVVARLNAELNRMLRAPDLRQQFRAWGMETVGGSPDQFASVLDADVRYWGEVMRKGMVAE